MYEIERRKTRLVKAGKIAFGSDAPLVIQSMNSTDTRDVEASLKQIAELKEAGCHLTRLAVPDFTAANALKEIVKYSPLPIVADIHFDYKLALAAIDANVCKIRINPGNMKMNGGLKEVVQAAKAKHIAIRVGVNAGSLNPKILRKYGGPTAEALVESAKEAINMLEEENFYDIVLSLKSSFPLLTIQAYRLMANVCDYPFHIGVTEAGTLREGTIRSAVGIGTLLAEGIGDTLRVSLTAAPVEEVKAAISILKSLGLSEGLTFISCPTCGRTEVDLINVANEVEKRLADIKVNAKVAVMGCKVNGPGEARGADYGIAGGKGNYLLFKKGVTIKKVSEDGAIDALISEILQDQAKAKTAQAKI